MNNKKKEKPPKRFVRVFKEKTSEENHNILADRETGVHYLMLQNGIACAVTPLLDAKGKVIVQAIPAPPPAPDVEKDGGK